MQPRFIPSQHPKHSVRPTLDQVRELLRLGWVGQPKIYGHRLQVHVSPEGELCEFTRHGTRHTKQLSSELKASLKAYADKTGSNVFDAEWVKPLNQIFLFDILRVKGETLSFSTYEERYRILRDLFQISPHIKLLKILKTEKDCMSVLEGDDQHVEGLVFKSWDSKGWPDSAIVRCLKK